MANQSCVKNITYPTNLILAMKLKPECIHMDDFINAVERLPDSEIDLLEIRYRDNFEISDIACIMEKTRAQIVKNLNLALHRLRQFCMNSKNTKRMEYEIELDKYIEAIRNEYFKMPVVEMSLDDYNNTLDYDDDYDDTPDEYIED